MSEEATSRGSTATTPPSARFSALLLGGNPGIGAGALGALWDGSGTGSSNSPRNGLFPSLLRLDLSRCGLTAVDLIGLSPASGDGGFYSSSPSQTAAVVCLRALVLRDNPLSRLIEGGAGEGAPGWIEPARRGAAALRDLIAQASGLEILDVSGEKSRSCRRKVAPNQRRVTEMCIPLYWSVVERPKEA